MINNMGLIVETAVCRCKHGCECAHETVIRYMHYLFEHCGCNCCDRVLFQFDHAIIIPCHTLCSIAWHTVQSRHRIY
jgi:hypothetical protein